MSKQEQEQKLEIICGLPLNVTEITGIPYTPAPGSIETPCENCGNLCWMGPRQSVAKALLNYPFWCATCVMKTSGQESFTNIKSLGGP